MEESKVEQIEVPADEKLFVVGEAGEGEILTDDGPVKYQYEYPKIYSAAEALTFETEEIKNYCLNQETCPMKPTEVMSNFVPPMS